MSKISAGQRTVAAGRNGSIPVASRMGQLPAEAV
jgi:hypothetical protein